MHCISNVLKKTTILNGTAQINMHMNTVTVTGSDTEVSDNTVSLFDRLRIYELSLETGGE